MKPFPKSYQKSDALWIGPKNDSIQYSIQNSIKNIHSINYSFNGEKIIQFNIQFKIEWKIYIQSIIHSNWREKITAWENSEKQAKGARSVLKRQFYY